MCDKNAEYYLKAVKSFIDMHNGSYNDEEEMDEDVAKYLFENNTDEEYGILKELNNLYYSNKELRDENELYKLEIEMLKGMLTEEAKIELERSDRERKKTVRILTLKFNENLMQRYRYMVFD